MSPSRPEQSAQVDVLVVGLGPAGASSAGAAAARGCSVMAIDKRRQPGLPVQCAEFVPQALRCHGIDNTAIVQAIHSMRSSLHTGEVNTVSSSGFMLHRARFDTALINTAQDRGASILSAASLQQLDVSRRVARIRTTTGPLQVRYKLLIAADGARSCVARLARRASLQTLRTQQYTVPLKTASAVLDVCLSPRYPGGYAWMFPKGDVANVGVGFVTRTAADLKQALVSLLQTFEGQGLVYNRILSRTGGEIPVSGMRNDLVREHIVFAGDAAGLTHPITGAGIAPAVISGEQAGACAAEYIFGAGSMALVDYVENLRDVYQPVLSRALQKRRQLLQAIDSDRPLSESVLRQCWAGFPEYFH